MKLCASLLRWHVERCASLLRWRAGRGTSLLGWNVAVAATAGRHQLPTGAGGGEQPRPRAPEEGGVAEANGVPRLGGQIGLPPGSGCVVPGAGSWLGTSTKQQSVGLVSRSSQSVAEDARSRIREELAAAGSSGDNSDIFGRGRRVNLKGQGVRVRVFILQLVPRCGGSRNRSRNQVAVHPYGRCGWPRFHPTGMHVVTVGIIILSSHHSGILRTGCVGRWWSQTVVTATVIHVTAER